MNEGLTPQALPPTGGFTPLERVSHVGWVKRNGVALTGAVAPTHHSSGFGWAGLLLSSCCGWFAQPPGLPATPLCLTHPTRYIMRRIKV